MNYEQNDEKICSYDENSSDLKYPIIGYMSFYLKAIDVNKRVIYLEFESDFRKPLTKDFFNMFIDVIKEDCSDSIGVEIINIEFITKEEYVKNNNQKSSGGYSIEAHKDDNGNVEINRVDNNG